MSESARDRFTALLRELFEFDCADLDFGIYRILNYKRKVIEAWIDKGLPEAVAQALQQGELAEQAQAQQELQQARKEVEDALGSDALDAEGNLEERYHDTRVGKRYLEACKRAAGARARGALEADIYNHLYTFFSRYWQDGDFISKRRYSAKERYAIPYNGEEVYLYWANYDQYYIKTGEYFTDYAYKAPNGMTIRFKLHNADVEQNNVKGEKRFFLIEAEGMTWEAEQRVLTIPVVFRPLTDDEAKRYGQRNQQEAIIQEAVEAILKHAVKFEDEALLAALNATRQQEDGREISLLEHHLRRYTRRNTSDFFIHKDLRGFLSRELDFYLKNEVLNLDEIEAAGERRAEGWLQLMRAIKRVGSQIIEFLAQIEDFQKMLWEKKKFVTETFYVVTVGAVPEAFYSEIAANDKQWAEWEALFSLNALSNGLFSGDLTTPEGRVRFLKAHPALPLDTRHFDQTFVDRLLATFEGLDEVTDGLLVHSENWQALNLLKEKYRERMRCIYIDPPYNTGTDEFAYKDNYRHSCWLTMMENRMVASSSLLSETSALFTSIGNEEQAHLRLLLESILGANNFRSGIVYRRGAKSLQVQFDTIDRLNQGYDLLLMMSKREDTRYRKLMIPKLLNEDSSEDKSPENTGRWNNHWRGTDRPSMRYPLFGITPTHGQWRWEQERSEQAIKNYQIMCRELGSDAPSQEAIDDWVRKKEAAGEQVDLLRLSATGKPEHYVRPSDQKLSSDLWIDLKPNGSRQIASLFETVSFESAKSTSLVERIVKFVCDEDSIVLDYFAGSGTTAHAVINLNREDGGQRKFILVEMANYFDTVLLPRVKKVTFTPEWRDGKPQRLPTPEEAERSPRVIKVIRLESYEDALNNLTFDEESGQQARALFKDKYVLRYMLKWETRKSETLLDVDKLQTPFAYQLQLHRNGETQAQPVDLPETFVYLLGLDVETRRVYHDGGRRYLVYRGTQRNGRCTAVIWRDTHKWAQGDYERDRDFVAEHKLTEGADEVFVNSDSLIPGAQSLDPVFKARLFAGV
ncbi:MAG: site-specific DNA-methyltransferase [Anaerolineae bacterium]|nr:site-specific DNA-methyltransferase [Anaerolineae bacterium]